MTGANLWSLHNQHVVETDLGDAAEWAGDCSSGVAKWSACDR
jgi:hypothetical protein